MEATAEQKDGETEIERETEREIEREAARREFGPHFLGVIGSYGSQDGQFQYPAGIALDEQKNRLYIADTFNNRIQVFRASDGKFQFKFGGHGSAVGQLYQPHALAIDKSKGWLWVSDRCNHRIQIFSATDGAYLHSWGGLGTEPGRFHCPSALALDCRADMLFVVDEGNHRVQAFRASDGTYLYALVASFIGPGAVAFDCATDLVLVSDRDNHITVFETSAGLPLARHPFGASKAMVVRESGRSLLGTHSDGWVRYWKQLFDGKRFSIPFVDIDPSQRFGPVYQFAVHPSDQILYIADCCNNRIVILRNFL